jgi:glutathione S-transferase
VIKLYFAPRTRAVRILWLLEELALPYELERVEFLPPAKEFFVQRTPTGKLPTIEDGDVVMAESGAITEYILEKYGKGRLAPRVGSAARARYLQWLHFAEATAFPPLGIVVWLSRYRGESEKHADLVADAKDRARAGIEQVEREIGDGPYLLGEDFTAADIMLGFTLAAALMLGLLDDRYPKTGAYLGRLMKRPAFEKVAAIT